MLIIKEKRSTIIFWGLLCLIMSFGLFFFLRTFIEIFSFTHFSEFFIVLCFAIAFLIIIFKLTHLVVRLFNIEYIILNDRGIKTKTFLIHWSDIEEISYNKNIFIDNGIPVSKIIYYLVGGTFRFAIHQLKSINFGKTICIHCKNKKTIKLNIDESLCNGLRALVNNSKTIDILKILKEFQNKN